MGESCGKLWEKSAIHYERSLLHTVADIYGTLAQSVVHYGKSLWSIIGEDCSTPYSKSVAHFGKHLWYIIEVSDILWEMSVAHY